MKTAIYPGSFDPVTAGHLDIIRRAAGLCDRLHSRRAGQQNADTIIKGLRAVSDFEYEFQMALANRKLNPNLDTVFLMTSAEHMYLSSSIVKDIAAHGGDITGLVPDSVKNDILLRIRKDGNTWQH